ncbi:MAG: aminotransferase class IV [Syntrophobacterales bacterium]|nr:aminotransferase class IV [Syntrophobacterales bacterium]
MSSRETFVWLNDELLPLSQARVSVLDRGFLYGDGLFETLKAVHGRVELLGPHLERLASSARELRLPFPSRYPFTERLARLLAVNRLVSGLAAVKIILTRGEHPELGLPGVSRGTLVITARPYTPPPPEDYRRGWATVIFPARRTTFLGRLKSLNYLFYLAARQYARDRGVPEALILEADGRLSEAATANLVLLRAGVYETPAAPSALPGVTLAALARGLAARGRELVWVPLRPADLWEAEGLWLINSLLGLLPVRAVDGREVPVNEATGRFLTECLAEAVAAAGEWPPEAPLP